MSVASRNPPDSLEINDACIGTAVAVAGERSLSAQGAEAHLLEHQMRIHTRMFVVLVFAVLAPVPLIAQTAPPRLHSWVIRWSAGTRSRRTVPAATARTAAAADLWPVR